MYKGVISILCKLSDLKDKEVVCVKTGLKLGYVDDVLLDTEDETVKSFIIYGRLRFFGLFGRDSDIVVKCTDIELVGEDTILVTNQEQQSCTIKKKSALESLFK